MTDDIKIADVVLHYVGNATADEGITLSTDSLNLSEEVVPYLKYYFLSAFKLEALCNFFHEAKLTNNPMFSFAEEIFEKKRSFCEVSSDIARHLYKHSNHPKINGGDFFVVLFKNCEVDHQKVDAIGLFKAESQDRYIKVVRENSDVAVDLETGVNIKNLDKGCLIFNIEKNHGYVVAVVDRTKRGSEAKYWIDDFLHVVPRNDGYNQTKKAISLCKDYIKSLPGNIDKSQRAIMLNRLTEFLKKDDFSLQEMVNCVFYDENTAQGFLRFNQEAIIEEGGGVDNYFKPEQLALKKISFGNLTNIKLDDNFGISIRGGENLLEKGYDEERGMKYYKLYFKEER